MAPHPHETIIELVRQVTERMHLPCEVAVTAPEEDTSPLLVDVQVPDNAKLLIGKNGQNLQALEHVLRAMLVRQHGFARSISVDVNGYRKEKFQELVGVIQKAAQRVRDTGKSEALPPMTSYERRVVHTELASWSDLTTESIGQDPQRRVVIKLP